MSDKTTLSGRAPEIPTGPAPGPIDPATGKHTDYWVLTEDERAKGFVRPVRTNYRHTECGTTTLMARAIAETFARDPYFYSHTYCAECESHPPVTEFVWPDGSTVGS